MGKEQEHSPKKKQRTSKWNLFKLKLRVWQGQVKPSFPTSHTALRHPALALECFLGSHTKPLSSKVFRGQSRICCHSTTLAVLLSRNNDRHVFLKSTLLIFSDKNWSTATRILAAIKPKAFQFPLKYHWSFCYFFFLWAPFIFSVSHVYLAVLVF